MKTNMDKIRQKLAKLNGEERGNKVLKLEIGEQTFRIVPTSDGETFYEVHFHYLKYGIPCLKKNWNEDCPICEEASRLWNDSDPETKQESQITAKKLFVKQRYYAPVVVRGKEEDGVKIFSFGVSNYKKFIDDLTDPDVGDFTDIFEGRDIKVKKVPAKGPGTYPEVICKLKSPSPLVKTKEEALKILETIPDIIAEVAPKKSSKEMVEELDKFLKPSEATSFNTEEFDSAGDEKSALDEIAENVKG